MALRDDRRFVELYERHYQRVYAYCRRRTTPENAEDTTADVFLVAWRRIADCPVDPDRAMAWLYGIAYRRIGQVWRGAARRRRLSTKLDSTELTHHESPDDAVIVRAEHALVMRATLRLRAVDQEILRLALWEELSPAAISDVLGINDDAVRQRLSRAKKRLTSEFNKLENRSSTPVAWKGGRP